MALCGHAQMSISDNNSIVILADGSYPSGAEALSILDSAERVVCCDGAACEYVTRGGTPYAIVGDCDSLPEELSVRFSDIVYRDSGQETNDLTKAVRFCFARGFTDITILGATGRREDHTLGNISLLIDYCAREIDESVRKRVPGLDGYFTDTMAIGAQTPEQKYRMRMVTDYGIFEPIFGDTFFESFEGEQISIFTFSPQTLITTVNLAFPLEKASLTAWWQGSLNESLGAEFGIRTTGPTIIYRLLR